MKTKKLPFLILTAAVLLFTLAAAFFPKPCARGAAEGILLSGRVIIPSLFPFTACVLFLMRSQAADFLNPILKPLGKLFGIPAELVPTVLFSLVGGYPTGAKLLGEAVKNGQISQKDAGLMLCWCTNAGPAFVVSAVGLGAFNSEEVGLCLLGAHLVTSILMGIGFRFFTNTTQPTLQPKICRPVADIFVSSVSDAAQSLLSICAYVILFSSISSVIYEFAESLPFLKLAAALLEVTNAAAKAESLPFAAFLLGFAGLCVWCQIISVAKPIKINLPLFASARLFHGVLSALLSAFLVKAFGISLTAAAINTQKITPDRAAISVSLFIMLCLLFVTLCKEKNTGNILRDIV